MQDGCKVPKGETRVWEREASFSVSSEFSVNDLVPSKVSSHRNTQKTRWYTDWLMEMWPETHRSPPLSLPSKWRLSGQRLQLTQRSPRPDDFPGQDYCTTLVQHRLSLREWFSPESDSLQGVEPEYRLRSPNHPGNSPTTRNGKISISSYTAAPFFSFFFEDFI